MEARSEDLVVLARDERRDKAIALVKQLVVALAEMGVSVKIIGSLTTQNFGHYSDVDLLVTECPRNLKYRIEGVVEDALPGFRFDVVYLDEIPLHRLHRFTEGQMDASDLR
jgi:predicted nucleotidyltransferase